MDLTPEQQAIFDKGVSKGIERAKEKESAWEKEKTELNGLIEKFKNQSTMTAAEKEEMQKKIQELEERSMSAEEKLKKGHSKALEEKEKALKTLTEERDFFVTRFKTEKAENAIAAAASKFGAFSPQQVVSLLHSRTEIEEELGEDKKPTGRFKIGINLTVPSEDGKSMEQKTFDVEEGVKAFLNLPENVNLGKANVAKTPNLRTTQGGLKTIKGMSVKEIQTHATELLEANARGELTRN